MSRKSTSRSWGHELRKLTPHEIESLRRRQAASVERWPDAAKYKPINSCATGKCRQDATHETAWSYVTGRAGRVSSQRRMVCDEHAAAFRAKHDLPEPEAAPGRESALDQAVREFTGAEDTTP